MVQLCVYKGEKSHRGTFHFAEFVDFVRKIVTKIDRGRQHGIQKFQHTTLKIIQAYMYYKTPMLSVQIKYHLSMYLIIIY